MSDHLVYPQRDAKGRFLPGHREASVKGGLARARSLSPQRRRQIARQGFNAFVKLYFNGDRAAAVEWLAAKGRWATDQHYTPALRKFEDPGPLPGGDA